MMCELWSVDMGSKLAGVGVDMYPGSDSPHPPVFSQFSERKAGDGSGCYK